MRKLLYLFAAVAISGFALAACSEKDEPQPVKPPVENPDNPSEPSDSVPTDTVPADTTATNERSYELHVAFVDNDGRDLLDASHPTTLHRSNLYYSVNGVAPMTGVMLLDNSFTDEAGLRYAVVKSQGSRHDRDDVIVITWAAGLHAETVTVSSDDNGSVSALVNGTEAVADLSKTIVFTIGESTHGYKPVSLPVAVVNSEGKAIEGATVTAIIDGKEYSAPEAEGAPVMIDMAFAGLGSIAKAYITDEPQEAVFGGVRIPSATYIIYGEPMELPWPVSVIGDFARDKDLDLTFTVRVAAPSADSAVDHEVRLVNTVKHLADYAASTVTIYLDGKDVTSAVMHDTYGCLTIAM